MDSTNAHFEAAAAIHLRSLYRYCHRMTGSKEEAEDLAQETLLAALKEGTGPRAEARMKAWLFGIAHHKVCHHLRRRSLERLFQAKPRVEPEFSEASAVQGLIDSLPPREKEAFLLVRVEGFTSLEAAGVLGVPEGTVKHRVFRAVKSLQDTILERGIRMEEAHDVQ